MFFFLVNFIPKVRNIALNLFCLYDFRSSDPDADDVGHKWSLSALLKHLKSENHDTGLLMRRIEEMIVKAILATAPPIVTACRLFVPYVENCFGNFFHPISPTIISSSCALCQNLLRVMLFNFVKRSCRSPRNNSECYFLFRV